MGRDESFVLVPPSHGNEWLTMESSETKTGLQSLEAPLDPLKRIRALPRERLFPAQVFFAVALGVCLVAYLVFALVPVLSVPAMPVTLFALIFSVLAIGGLFAFGQVAIGNLAFGPATVAGLAAILFLGASHDAMGPARNGGYLNAYTDEGLRAAGGSLSLVTTDGRVAATLDRTRPDGPRLVFAGGMSPRIERGMVALLPDTELAIAGATGTVSLYRQGLRLGTVGRILPTPAGHVLGTVIGGGERPATASSARDPAWAEAERLGNIAR